MSRKITRKFSLTDIAGFGFVVAIAVQNSSSPLFGHYSPAGTLRSGDGGGADGCPLAPPAVGALTVAEKVRKLREKAQLTVARQLARARCDDCEDEDC